MSELQLHFFVADYLRYNAQPGVLWFHVANGEIRDKSTAAKLKRMGLLPGVADIEVITPFYGSGGICYHKTYFLELKAEKGVLSPDQKIFAERCAAIGLGYEVARSPEQALTILLDWGAIVPGGGLMSKGKARSKTRAEAA